MFFGFLAASRSGNDARIQGDGAARWRLVGDAMLPAMGLEAALLDGDGVVVRANEAWRCHAHDFGKEEGRYPDGSRFLEAFLASGPVPEEQRSAVVERIAEVLRGTEPAYQTEYAVGGRSFEMTVQGLTWPQGGALVTHRETTQQIALQETAEEAEALARAFLEVGFDAAWTLSRKGVVTFANDESLRLMGLRRGEADGRGLGEWLGNPSAFHVACRAALFEGAPGQLQVEVKRSDGSATPTLMVLQGYGRAAHNPSGLVVVAKDLTASREAEGRAERLAAQLADSENRYGRLLDSVTDYVFTVIVRDGVPVSTTHGPGCVAVTGYTAVRFEEDPDLWLRMVCEEDRPAVLEQARRAVHGEPVQPLEHRIVHRDGSVRWIRNTPVVRKENGKVVSYEGLIYDITERKRAEQAAQRMNEELRMTNIELEIHGRDDAHLNDLSNNLHAANTADEAYAALQVYAPKLFPGSSGVLMVLSQSRELIEVAASWGEPSGEDPVMAPDACWALRRGRAHEVRPDEPSVTCQAMVSASPYGTMCIPIAAQGEALGVLQVRFGPPAEGLPAASLERVAEAKRTLALKTADTVALSLANIHLRRLLREQAIRDPLTGLFNRRYMEETLNREERRAVRQNTPISIVMIDIDRFKDFNDTYGHEAGDAALQMLGEYLGANFRGGDIPCRYGGEEFTLVMPGADPETAWHRADAARQEVEKLMVMFQDKAVSRVTISMGVAGYPGDGDSWSTVLDAADKALYQAKAAGRNRCVLASAKPKPKIA